MGRMASDRKSLSTDRKKWLPDYPEPQPGEWVRYDYGKDRRGWYLDCGPMFHADVDLNAGEYTLTLNMHPLAKNSDPEVLKRTAEGHIIARVRKMLPAYRVIYGRAMTGDSSG